MIISFAITIFLTIFSIVTAETALLLGPAGGELILPAWSMGGQDTTIMFWGFISDPNVDRPGDTVVCATAGFWCEFRVARPHVRGCLIWPYRPRILLSNCSRLTLLV